jgi:hypothetical protein
MVIYGCSLNLAGIAASLKAMTSLEVVCLDPHSPDARQALHDLHPAVIAFDLSEPFPNQAAGLLNEQPGLLLIGVDPNRNEVLVFSGQAKQAHLVQDLLKVIEAGIHLPAEDKTKEITSQPSNHETTRQEMKE